MKRKTLGYIVGAAAISLSSMNLANAHDEPDFSKLPDVQHISRIGVVSSLTGQSIYSANMIRSTMFKLGENSGKHYYATADHINKIPLSEPNGMHGTLYEEFRYDNHKMELEFRDIKNDIMIVSTERDFEHKAVKICDTPPELGEDSFIYGYHRGHLSLTEGRLASLKSDIMKNGKTYYQSNATALTGSSGSPSIVYRDGEFCAYGMVLLNLNSGVFSLARDIKYTLDAYEEVLKE